MGLYNSSYPKSSKTARNVAILLSGISHRKFTDRLRRLVNEGRIMHYLNDMELRVSDAISRQVELWKQTDSCYLKAVLSGDAEKMLGLENCFVYMAREAVFECMVYI